MLYFIFIFCVPATGGYLGDFARNQGGVDQPATVFYALIGNNDTQYVIMNLCALLFCYDTYSLRPTLLFSLC